MTDLIIRHIPEELHQKLKAQALHNHRSMNKEAIALLEQSLTQAPAIKEAPSPYKGKFKLTQSFIDKAKRQGRA